MPRKFFCHFASHALSYTCTHCSEGLDKSIYLNIFPFEILMTNPSFIHLFIHGISEATTVYQAIFFRWYGFTVSLSLFFWNGIYLPFINTSLLDTFVSHYTCPIRLAVRRLIFFPFSTCYNFIFFFKDIFAFIWLCIYIWIISYIC